MIGAIAANPQGNVAMWIALSIIAVIALACCWKRPNAIWGMAVLGLVAAVILRIKGIPLERIGKFVVILILIGIPTELLYKLIRHLRFRSN